MYLMTCTRPDLAYPLSLLARYVAPGRHRKVHWDAAKRVLRYLCSTLGMGLVLGGRARVVLTGHADASWVDDLATSSCEAEIYAGAMAAQELRWLTYLLTDLGEAPRSPPILYVDNKAMLALCQEHRLEHKTKHIALRYFLARELLQRGQLRLAYVASQANTADVFTKALQPCDHQRFPYDQILSLDPTSLTVDLLEEHLLKAETSVVAVDAVRGTPRTPFFEGCSPSPLATSYASAAAADVPGTEDIAAPPCLPCVEGRQRGAPHSSFPPTTAPLHTLHMDVWGPARVSRQGRERYFLKVWTTTRGGEFSSDLLWDFCHGEGILQSFILPDSPQQNGLARCRIGLVMEFYHPTLRRVLPSQDVTFDESVPFYRLFPYRSAPLSPLLLSLAPGPPLVDPLPPQGLALSGVSQVDPPSGAMPCEVVVDSGAARGTALGGAEPGGAERGGAEIGRAEPGGTETGGAETGGAEPDGVEPGGAQSEGAESGAAGAGRLGAAGAGGAGVTAGAGVLGGIVATGPGGARTQGTGAAGSGGVGGARAGDPTESGAAGARNSGVGAGGAGQVLGVLSSTSLSPPLLCPPPDQSQPSLQPASPLPAPSPYTEQTGGLTERRDLASRPASPVCTSRRVPRLHPPPVPGTHALALCPSSVSLRVPLPAPPKSSLPAVLDPESDHVGVASPTVSHLLATVVTDPSFESSAVSALVAELLDFAAAYRLDYAIALASESDYASPPSVEGECALGTDVLEDRKEDFECLAAAVPRFASTMLALEGDMDAPDIPTPRSNAEAITGPYSSQWQAAMDVEMASWKSTSTYIDEVPPPWANIVDGMLIFRVKRPPGSLPAFKERYVARGFSQRQGVDYFHAFSPTLKMTTLRVLLNVAAQRDYELHSLDFSTSFLQGSLHEEIWLRRPPGFTGSFPAGLHLRLLDLLLLRTDTSLPPFYVLVYVDDLVFATADTEALTLLKSELQKRHTYTDLDPSALRLPVLLATAHSSVYQPFALSFTFGRVRRAKRSVPRACGLPHVPDDVHTT
ncbi:unnamed protein product [Closterium sp. NIES-53]